MSKKQGFSCPVCDEIFSENELSQHVDGHFDDKQYFDYTMVKCRFPGCHLALNEKDMEDHLIAHRLGDEETPMGECSKFSPDLTASDSMLAKIMQEEQNLKSQKRIQDNSLDHATAQRIQKEEEKKMEAEEFKRLQKKFGMNSAKASYCQQFEKNMQRKAGENTDISDYFKKKANLHASMISGNDTNESRTTGLMQILKGIYACGIAGVTKCYLCTETDHYSSDVCDRGWGCGYRNLQMVLSSMLRISPFNDHISKGIESANVPSIPRIQTLIEKAWKDGYDTSGCEQLGGKLLNTKKWIGATEVATLFRWLGIRARIVDFHQAAPDNTHPLLFEWVTNYFKTNEKSQTNPSFPLYLQHQGHSRLCIGVETLTRDNGQLLIFDPSHPPRKMAALKNLKLPCTATQLRDFRKSIKQMKQSQFQLVFIDGVYDNDREREESKVLNAIRLSKGIL